MNVGLLLARGRARAEALMTDTCLIEREGTPVTGSDGQVTRPKSTIYSGKCRLQSRGDWSTERDIGEAGLVLLQTELQVPVSVVARVNDLVTVTVSPTAVDLVNRVFRVRGLFLKTHDTSNKMMLQEIVG